MTSPAAPLRFLIIVTGGWTFGRAAFLLPGLGSLSGGTAVAVTALATVPLALEVTRPPALPPPSANVTLMLADPYPGPGGGITIPLDEPDAAPSVGKDPGTWRLASFDIIPAPPPSIPPPALETSSAAPRPSRWSGTAWLLARPDESRPGLAAGGQLGGSQAGIRLAYRLADWGSGSLALAARVSTPLRDADGAEASVGIDWHPVKKLPFRLSLERRVAVGREGRNAWSAYAAGGFYRGGLPAGLEVDGYAQAGVVGARSQDLFADGAVRLGRPIPLSGGARLALGAGVWGAAQPGANRLDIGPRAALSLPVAGATVTGAVDWRIRVAGNAIPHSGAAFTLASDF